MTGATPISEEDLVAYLDAALSPARRTAVDAALAQDSALRGRLDALRIDIPAIRAAFDAHVATAPLERLRRALAAIPEPRRRRHAPGAWLAIAASLLIGVVLGQVSPRLFSQQRPTDWRTAVAGYQMLYTTATLASQHQNAAALSGSAAAVGAALGRPISLASLTVDGLDFKRAQILTFNGQPLAQYAYLDADGAPIAFCATRTGEPDHPVETTTLRGMAEAHWSHDGYGFMVIGGHNPDEIRKLADELHRST
jgi:anti-sigma factor RsiW